MKCSEIMKRNLEWVKSDDTVERAARLMRDANVGILPVCDDEAHVLGVLTDRDVATRVAATDKLASATLVAEVMTRSPVSCRPDDDLTEAEDKMVTFEKSRVLVTDKTGLLVGVISLTDILERDSGRRSLKTARKVTARDMRD